jgi:hypothetical protein
VTSRLRLDHLWLTLAIAAIALCGMIVFPGRTWLQSDTQIYIPMFERLWDPTLYANELIASRPHLSWTIYDDTALLARSLTHASFEHILLVEQFLFRALAILGVYLIGRRFAESHADALLMAAIVSLGATILGPSVLSFEYEPVPRGFAISLLFCAIGLSIHGETVWASVLASFAFLYHAPTTVPFWILFAAVILRTQRWTALLPPIAAAAVLALFARLQPGATESQHFFDRIPAAIQELQRLRAPYNWVSLWPGSYFTHYGIIFTIGIAALIRIRHRMDFTSRVFFAGLPTIGMLSIPLSYLMLEYANLAVAPQWQPARGVLFVTVCGVILCYLAAAEVAPKRKWEAFLWLMLPFVIPIHRQVQGPYPLNHVILIASLAALATVALAYPRLQIPAAAVTYIAAVALIPTYGQVDNFAQIHSRGLDDLAAWARHSTPKDAVFLFPSPAKSLEPGIFRVKSLRAVYVDWKAGGQVNYFNELGLEWWRRWQQIGIRNEIPQDAANYIVFRTAAAPAGITPA